MPDTRTRIPAGERLAALEANSATAARDIGELKGKADRIEAAVQDIAEMLAQQRGANRVTRVLLGVAQTLGGGVVGALAARLFGHA